MKRFVSLSLLALVIGLAQAESANAQILGGHGIRSGASHTFGGYNGVGVHTYQEPLAARPVAPVWSGYPNEPILSARTVTTAGEWPNGAFQPPAPVNFATIGPNSNRFFGWNSFWWYDPSQGSPIWNPYNRGHY